MDQEGNEDNHVGRQGADGSMQEKITATTDKSSEVYYHFKSPILLASSIQKRDSIGTSPKNNLLQPFLLRFGVPSTGSGSVAVCVHVESAGRAKSREFGPDHF